MAADGYVLNAELYSLVRRMVLRAINAQPRPKKLRRPRARGDSDGDSKLQAIWMIVESEVGPPSGDTSEVTPGTGTAIRYSTNSTTKARTPTVVSTGDPPFDTEAPVNVANYHNEETYEVNTGIYCSYMGAFPADPLEPGGETEDWYEVICGDCDPWDEPA